MEREGRKKKKSWKKKGCLRKGGGKRLSNRIKRVLGLVHKGRKAGEKVHQKRGRKRPENHINLKGKAGRHQNRMVSVVPDRQEGNKSNSVIQRGWIVPCLGGNRNIAPERRSEEKTQFQFRGQKKKTESLGGNRGRKDRRKHCPSLPSR